jgi:predicted patatin/cPLA2 family phospholipase
MAGLRQIKAKIIRLHAAQESSMLLDIGTRDRYCDEKPSLYHFLESAKRRRQRLIKQILTTETTYVQTTEDILKLFSNYYEGKYGEISPVNDSKMKILAHVNNRLPEMANMAFYTDITEGAIYGDMPKS